MSSSQKYFGLCDFFWGEGGGVWRMGEGRGERGNNDEGNGRWKDGGMRREWRGDEGG